MHAAPGAIPGAARPLGHVQMLLWAAGTHGTSAMIGILVVFFLFYCTNQLGLSAFVAGQILFWVRAYDLVADLAIGHASDRTRSALGRRRPWLLAGALGSFAGFAMLFNVPALGADWQVAAYVAAALVLYTTAYSVFNIPHLAMPAEMTDDRHARTVMMAWRMIFFTTANLLTLVGGNVILQRQGGAAGWSTLGWVVGGSVLLAMLVSFVGTRRAVSLPRTERLPPMREQLRVIAANRPFRLYVVAKTGMLAAQASATAAMLYFGEYVLQRADLLQVFGIWVTLGTLGSAAAWAWFSRRRGKKPAFIAACAGYGLVMLSWLAAGPGEADALLNARLVLLGIALGGVLVIGFSILPDTMAHDREQTGTNREGVYAGIYSLMEKAANAIGPLVFSAYLAAAGYVSTTGGKPVAQPDAAVSAIYMALAVFPALAAFFAAAVFVRYPERR
jgi:GPH family glycoside/pentoside/hexuronide:cation symporter